MTSYACARRFDGGPQGSTGSVEHETWEDVVSRLFAIVDIDNGPLLLIISSVFIVAFAVVCAIAYLLLTEP